MWLWLKVNMEHRADGEMGGSYPDGEVWTGPCGPPEFRRSFDLRMDAQWAE
jgi:hypothetical protein